MGKLLSHYEIYKQIVGLPGDILELGVFKGASLVRWATFRELVECQSARRITGFDAFGKFPVEHLDTPDGLSFAQEHDEGSGTGISKEDLEQILRDKGIANVELIKGNVFDTLPDYLEQNQHCKLSLLHLDMDVYEPTYFALEKLWSRLLPGGLLVVDDYNAVDGATRAVDEFFQKHPSYNQIQAARYYHVPTVFVK